MSHNNTSRTEQSFQAYFKERHYTEENIDMFYRALPEEGYRLIAYEKYHGVTPPLDVELVYYEDESDADEPLLIDRGDLIQTRTGTRMSLFDLFIYTLKEAKRINKDIPDCEDPNCPCHST